MEKGLQPPSQANSTTLGIYQSSRGQIEGIKSLFEKTSDHPVGLGGHADVWKLNMKSNGHLTEARIMVAAKVLRLKGLDEVRLRQRLEREVRCWERLHHEHIALFYGIVHGVVYHPHGLPAIVSHWYQNGTANEYILQHPNVNPMVIILEIATGLDYLHGSRIVHGDLKGTNVMIDDNGHARLIDFGLSRILDSEAGLTTSTTSSIRWSAPELLESSDAKVTISSDIYAFASTAFELLTGCVPYCGLPNRAVYQKVVSGANPGAMDHRYRYNFTHPRKLEQVLEACWARSSSRPHITKIRKDLLQVDVQLAN